MKHIKIYEEFEIDSTEKLNNIPFTKNELALFASKTIYNSYSDTYAIVYFNTVQKLEDNYYVVNRKVKCISISEVIKYCKDKYIEFDQWVDSILNTCEIKETKNIHDTNIINKYWEKSVLSESVYMMYGQVNKNTNKSWLKIEKDFCRLIINEWGFPNVIQETAYEKYFAYKFSEYEKIEIYF